MLGRHTPDDDIPIIAAIAPGLFKTHGKMQGGEFVVNLKATGANMERLNEINSFTDSEPYQPMTSIELTDATRIYNTNTLSSVRVLIDEGQYIINRAATRKYYKELVEINNAASEPWNKVFGVGC